MWLGGLPPLYGPPIPHPFPPAQRNRPPKGRCLILTGPENLCAKKLRLPSDSQEALGRRLEVKENFLKNVYMWRSGTANTSHLAQRYLQVNPVQTAVA